MNKIDAYRGTLRGLTEWEPYLRKYSGLPGPRGNLELAYAAAEEVDSEQIARWLALTPEHAPENTPEVFLMVCATVALGRLLAEGQQGAAARLRGLANDPRWRVREAVAMALQRLGDASVDQLLAVIQPWVEGTLLEQRAAAAAICEPRLLLDPRHTAAALGLLDEITRGITGQTDRKSEEFRVLRKALAYCWSVAVVAHPQHGKTRFAAWLTSPDPNVRWILRENLKKNRLLKMDAGWVADMQAQWNHPTSAVAR